MMKRAPTFFEQKRAQEMHESLNTARRIFAELTAEIKDINNYHEFDQALELRNLPEDEARLILCELTKYYTNVNSIVHNPRPPITTEMIRESTHQENERCESPLNLPSKDDDISTISSSSEVENEQNTLNDFMPVALPSKEQLIAMTSREQLSAMADDQVIAAFQLLQNTLNSRSLPFVKSLKEQNAINPSPTSVSAMANLLH